METQSSFSEWHTVPFGAETDEGAADEGNGNPAGSVGTQPDQSQSSVTAQGTASSGAKGASAASSSADDDDEDEYKDLTPRELRRLARDLANKAKGIESERDSLKTKVDEEERKTRSKEENLQKDLETERSVNSMLRATNARLAILGAIRDDTRYEWHDPEMVAQQLNSETVKVSEDGKVENLKKELDRIAKDHEFLLKKKANQPVRQPNNGGPTGFQPGQGGANNGGSGQPDLKELAKSYPALINRAAG